MIDMLYHRRKQNSMEKGEKYGRLTAVRFVEKRQNYRPFWEFSCECGNKHIANAYNVKSGQSKSCGCYANEVRIGSSVFVNGSGHPSFIDGDCDMKKSKFYRVYRGIIQRCNNKNNSQYKNYGGRGIKVEWDSYIDFKRDMKESFDTHVAQYGGRNTSIDRIDVDGNYCKENCRWATYKEQSRNTRRNVYTTVFGETMIVKDAMDKFGHNLVKRLMNGWDTDQAETLPLHSHRKLNIGETVMQEKNYIVEKKKIMELFKRSSTIVSTYLSVLEQRERKIIELRFGLKTGKRMTLEEIGKEQGVSRERIRQIEAKAIEKMIRFYSELAY